MPLPTSSLWPVLPTELAHEILLHVQKSNKKLYRQVLDLMAPRMGIRVPVLIETPKSERHVHFVRILSRPDMEVLSFNILSFWLVDSQVPMLNAWLDSLGIAHGDNGCADVFPPQPPTAALKKGVDLLVEKFDPVKVTVYLRAFNLIDDTQWPDLDKIIAEDPRLQLKPVAEAPAQS